MKQVSVVATAVIVLLAATYLGRESAEGAKQGVVPVDAKAPGPVAIDRAALCIYDTVPEGCLPNVHRLFSNIREYDRVDVYLQAFARLGPRGEIHIYPSNDAACRPVSGTAIKVNPGQPVPTDLRAELWRNGIAMVSVGGTVRVDRSGLMWAEIGSLEGGGIAWLKGSVIYQHAPEGASSRSGRRLGLHTRLPPVECLAGHPPSRS